MKKYPYFPDGEGLSRRTADLTEQMRVIAYRYMGDNVPLPYTLRRMPEDFFRQEGAGTYVIDLQEKLGSGRDGYAFAAGLVHSHADTVIPVSLGCMSPCWIWLNGEQMVDIEDEKIGAGNGRIALQIHDGGGIKVRWRNLHIKTL